MHFGIVTERLGFFALLALGIRCVLLRLIPEFLATESTPGALFILIDPFSLATYPTNPYSLDFADSKDACLSKSSGCCSACVYRNPQTKRATLAEVRLIPCIVFLLNNLNR